MYQNAALRLYRALKEVHPTSVRGFFGLAVTQIRRTLLDLARHYYSAAGMGTAYESHFEQNSKRYEANHLANDSAESLELWARFHSAVEALPEAEKEAFSLIWYGGLGQQRVAELTGVSDRTVKRRYYRARILLAGLLGDEQMEGR